MISNKDKKAQEFSIVTLVVLVLAIIVLVVVVLGFWKGWDYVFGKIGILPGGLEAAAQSCKISAEASLATSYCYEFKTVPIAGKNQYANCEYLAGYTTAFTPLASGCEADKVQTAAKALCQNVKKDIYINAWHCGTTGTLG